MATTGHLTSSYPGWRASSLGAITERVEQHLVFDLAGPLAGLAVPDVGCGDGTYAIEAAARGARAVGLDAEPAMLREVERRARERGVAVDLHERRAEDLPSGDASFDVVFAVKVLCFVADAGGAIREMVRVLVPGGRLVLGELGRFSTWAAWRRLRGWLGSTTWRGARFRSAQDLRGFLRGAGLEVERVTTLGAAFLTAAARKPGPDKPQGEPS